MDYTTDTRENAKGYSSPSKSGKDVNVLPSVIPDCVFELLFQIAKADPNKKAGPSRVPGQYPEIPLMGASGLYSGFAAHCCFLYQAMAIRLIATAPPSLSTRIR